MLMIEPVSELVEKNSKWLAHSAVSIVSNLSHFGRLMPDWPRSAGSGPFTWMLSNAISAAWLNRQ